MSVSRVAVPRSTGLGELGEEDAERICKTRDIPKTAQGLRDHEMAISANARRRARTAEQSRDVLKWHDRARQGTTLQDRIPSDL